MLKPESQEVLKRLAPGDIVLAVAGSVCVLVFLVFLIRDYALLRSTAIRKMDSTQCVATSTLEGGVHIYNEYGIKMSGAKLLILVPCSEMSSQQFVTEVERE